MNAMDNEVVNDEEFEEEQVDEDPQLVLAQPMGDKKIPLFLEFSLTATKLVVLIAAILVAVISIISKATWYDILLRLVVTLFVLGLFGVLFNFFVGRSFVDATILELEDVNAQRELRERELLEKEEAESSMDALEA